MVYQFIEFGGCADNVIFISITCVVAFLMYGLVLLRTRMDASIMTSAFVFSYALYLQWSALSSGTNGCSPYLYDDANTYTLLSFGLFFTFTTLFVISASTKSAAEDESVAMAANAVILEEEQDNYEKVADIEEGGKKKTAEEMHVFPITRATIMF